MAGQLSSPATETVFRDAPYDESCAATVLAVNEMGGIVLDRTVFYPTGGGQPGDSGVLRTEDGREISIATTVKGRAEDGGADVIVHVPAEGQTPPAPGNKVTAEIDWNRRHRMMRVHTCLHLLSAVLPYPVTGGQVNDGKGRLDFSIPEGGLDKEAITAELNRLIATDSPVGDDWISDDDLAANPDLVKTMSVKPPTGAGRVRLIRIEGLDLQPCGGTHVARTGEIGAVTVTKIESKGRQNRRVAIALNDNN
ncbi:MAG: alanyl-tRNA editing protein [Alphaproteobacteria bacterium]|nr:alanyl-tRNA editing protein [Alphaproteobacteria bacterium]